MLFNTTLEGQGKIMLIKKNNKHNRVILENTTFQVHKKAKQTFFYLKTN